MHDLFCQFYWILWCIKPAWNIEKIKIFRQNHNTNRSENSNENFSNICSVQFLNGKLLFIDRSFYGTINFQKLKVIPYIWLLNISNLTHIWKCYICDVITKPCTFNLIPTYTSCEVQILIGRRLSCKNLMVLR